MFNITLNAKDFGYDPVAIAQFMRDVQSAMPQKQKENTSKKVLELNRLGIGFHSKESKEKRTKTLKVKFNTLEMKEKLKLSARNRNRKIFIGYDSNHNIIGEFSNQTEAGEILNLKASEINAVLRQKQKTTKGYSFVYKNI